MGYGFKVIVEGDYAGFNRPELKTERVTYDVPTVGALEGMLKCVYWKPAFTSYIKKHFPLYNIPKSSNAVSNKVTPDAIRHMLLTVYWKPAFNKLFQKPTYTLKDVARKSEKELIIKWLTILK